MAGIGRASVMAAALDTGAAIVNVVSALKHNPGRLGVVAAAGCDLVRMHMAGDPAMMPERPRYAGVAAEVEACLAARIEAGVAAGIDHAKIVIEPGIGFGETLDYNLALLRGLDHLTALAPWPPIAYNAPAPAIFPCIDASRERRRRRWQHVSSA